MLPWCGDDAAAAAATLLELRAGQLVSEGLARHVGAGVAGLRAAMHACIILRALAGSVGGTELGSHSRLDRPLLGTLLMVLEVREIITMHQ